MKKKFKETNKMNITILSEKTYDIKPFSRVKIGDPLYFEEMENGSTNENLRTLTCDIDNITTSNRKAGARIRKLKCDYHDEDMDYDDVYYELTFYTARKTDVAEKIVEAELNGEYYVDLLKESRDLGCDTAEFIMWIDDNFSSIHTLADGHYGNMSRYKYNSVYVFNIVLNENAISWDKMEQMVKQFFNK